jgi:CRP-like cAMP-binding protein
MPSKPSLIPVDVLQEMRREEADLGVEHELFAHEPKTAPVPVVDDDAVVLGRGEADLEVAVFALSQVPLFRALPTSSLEALAVGAQQLDVPRGEALFVEGDEARSFYVVIDGALDLERDDRDVVLRQVKRGEALGLFGLFAGQLRPATARANGDCTVLELSAARLQQLLEHDDGLHLRLLEFFRERLVEGLLSSKLFTDLADSVARARLLAKFKNVELKAGATVMEPGEVSNLLCVVTHGRLMLEERARPGQQPRHFEVTQGQFMMVSSALSGQPLKLRVWAEEYATVSMLEHKDLNELLRDYPALRVLPKRLPGYANTLDRDVFCGTTVVTGL